MKNWYLMIHFDGSYVHGFLVFGTPDEDSARKKLIHQLQLRLKLMIALNKDKCYIEGASRQRSFLRTLNNPWRVTKRDKRPVIVYREMTDECVEADYWLKDVFINQSYCNFRTSTQD